MQQSEQSPACSKVQDAFAGSEKDVPELQPETPDKPKKEGKFILFQLAEDPHSQEWTASLEVGIDMGSADSDWMDASFLHAPPRASFTLHTCRRTCRSSHCQHQVWDGFGLVTV